MTMSDPISFMARAFEENYDAEVYNAILETANNSDYVLRDHLIRYLHTFKHLPKRREFGASTVRVLELGSNDIFPYILRSIFHYEEVEVCQFAPSLGKEFVKDLPKSEIYGQIKGFNIDLETEPIPRPDGHYDMVLCFELIEHLERDPMFMISEINRVLKPLGLIYLSTPNICSSRNVMKILMGYAPHFHMKYNRDASLYRHNIEYAPHQINTMLSAGGFRALKIWTADTFEPPSEETIALLENLGYPIDMRGDNFFGIYEKTSSVIDRWPSDIYA